MGLATIVDGDPPLTWEMALNRTRLMSWSLEIPLTEELADTQRNFAISYWESSRTDKVNEVIEDNVKWHNLRNMTITERASWRKTYNITLVRSLMRNKGDPEKSLHLQSIQESAAIFGSAA